MGSLDDIIKSAVKGIEDQRQVMKAKPLGAQILQTPETGFPRMVKCPKHGEMLTSINTITFRENGARVYYCMKCWKEYETTKMMGEVQRHANRCTPLDAGTSDIHVQPKMQGDWSSVK